MTPLPQAAFELRLDDLQKVPFDEAAFAGTLLAACSAHDADPAKQILVIRHLLKCGVPVNERDKNGVTPLHRAVRFRSTAAAKELLTHGADVNVIDKRTNSTPLHRAVTNTGAPSTAGKIDCAVEIARLLLTSGGDPSLANKSGKTPIEFVKNDALREVFRQHTAD